MPNETTPGSVPIYTAILVTAGIFLIARNFPIFEYVANVLD
jgi:NADH:ubiquinone oxidoreductase subunit 5 (subunit L)/multisubunit Na+/H+ antiporter MnhA subunit